MKDILKKIKKECDELSNAISLYLNSFKEKTDFDSLVKFISDRYDDLIIETCQKNRWKYYGGECTFSADNTKKRLTVNVKLYYQDELMQWQVQESNSTVPFDRILISDSEVKEKLLNSEMKFDIDSPNQVQGE